MIYQLKYSDRDSDVYHLLQTFSYSHLSEELQTISEPFYYLAHLMVDKLSDGPELIAGLRKLREAKDCMVIQSKIDTRGYED